MNQLPRQNAERAADPRATVIRFSRNFGKEEARALERHP